MLPLVCLSRNAFFFRSLLAAMAWSVAWFCTVSPIHLFAQETLTEKNQPSSESATETDAGSLPKKADGQAKDGKTAGGETAGDASESSESGGEKVFSPEVQAIIRIGKQESQVQDHLNVICNRIGPRLTSSEGLTAAGQWAKQKFESMGLANATMEQWGEFPVGFERGPASGQMLEPKAMDLQFGTNAWTAGTAGRTRGKVVAAPENLEALEGLKDQIAGAWVLSARSPRRRGMSAEERKELTDLRDAIKACQPAGFIRAASGELIITGGSFQVDWNDLPTIPEINLVKSQFDEISQMLSDGQEVVLSFDIRNFFRQGPIPLYNVYADIPGTEFPDEFVVVGGHLDSWDGATGATDNAAGSATTIEAARILMEAGVKPRRTIRFMLWSGEEQGLLGSRAYVKAHPEVIDKVSAVFVHDGGTNYVAGIGVPADMRSDIERAFEPAIGLDERAPFEITEIEAITAGGASDHSSFIAAGAPGFFWRQRGRAVYRDTHHTQFDTSETIVSEYQIHSATVIALGAYGVASLDTMLSRESVKARNGFGRGE